MHLAAMHPTWDGAWSSICATPKHGGSGDGGEQQQHHKGRNARGERGHEGQSRLQRASVGRQRTAAGPHDGEQSHDDAHHGG
eukprot:7135970-Prymnesium_polylepis.1